MENTAHDRFAGLYVENVRRVKARLKWKDVTAQRMAALIFAMRGLCADTDAIERGMGFAKVSAKMMSPYRGAVGILFSAAASQGEGYESTERVIGRALAVFERLRTEKFTSSEYLACAAMILALRFAEERDALDAALRMKGFYGAMREKHKIIVGWTSYPLMASLAASGLEIDEAVFEVERVYEEIRREIPGRDSAYHFAIAAVLLGLEDANFRIIRIKDALRQRGYAAHRGIVSLSLALAASAEGNEEEIAGRIAEICAEIRAEKGMGAFVMSKSELIIAATPLFLAERASLSQTAGEIAFAQAVIHTVEMIAARTATVT